MSKSEFPVFQEGGVTERKERIITEITHLDLKPIVPQVEGTALILQCNVPDYRGEPSGPVEIGSLTPEAVSQEQEIARRYFIDAFMMIPEAERKDVSIIVIGAGTKLLTEKGLQSDKKRGIETAEIVLSEVTKVLSEMGLSEDQIINKRTSSGIDKGKLKPSEIKERLNDVNFLKDSPDFTQYLIEKYGTGSGFWIAFEEMLEEEQRKETNAEGPEQIADRVQNYLGVLANGLRSWHQKNKGKRVLAWVVAHRDNLGPFFKVHVSRTGQAAAPEYYLNFRKGGGFVVDVAPDGQDAHVFLQGQDFPFTLPKPNSRNNQFALRDREGS